MAPDDLIHGDDDPSIVSLNIAISQEMELMVQHALVGVLKPLCFDAFVPQLVEVHISRGIQQGDKAVLHGLVGALEVDSTVGGKVDYYIGDFIVLQVQLKLIIPL